MRLMSRLTVLFLFLFSQRAQAFIPKNEYIFKALTEGREKVVSYKIDQTRVLYGREYENGKLELKEEVYLVMPWRYARKSSYGDKAQITIYDGSEALRMIGKKWTVPESKAVIPFIYGFYLSRDPDDLRAFLRSKGIDPDHTELSRINELIAILFKGTEKNRFDLFVDRDSFWPISYRSLVGETALNGKEYIRIMFTNYKNIYPKIFFPMKYSRFDKEILSEQVTVNEIKINGRVPVNIFDIANIKRKYQRFEKGIDPDYYSIDYTVQ